MSGHEGSTDFRRIAMIVLAAMISAAVGYQFQPMIADNPNAVDTVVTVFSILAGFLIAVISFIVDPALRRAETWDELQALKPTIRRRLFRHKALFVFYLLTLGLALALYLVPPALKGLQAALQGTFLGLATFVFLASFTLPGSLMRLQMERYEAALQDKQPKVVREALRSTDV